MENRTCSNCIFANSGECEFAGEITTDFTCEKHKFNTCYYCLDRNTCEFANDFYNIDDDCLDLK